MTTKKCNKCSTEKPTEQFSRNKKAKDGYQNYCKQCSYDYFVRFNQDRKDGSHVYVEAKKCIKCGQVKPRSQYSKRTVSKDGLNNYCKPCWRSYLNSRYVPKKQRAL